jgi:hypothetical protein
MAIAFFVLMRFVEKRQNKVVGEAAISNAIVSSLFPASVRKRLFADRATLLPQEAATSGKNALRSFLKGEGEDLETDGVILKAQPIADLFNEATIMCKFATALSLDFATAGIHNVLTHPIPHDMISVADIAGCKYCFSRGGCCVLILNE